MDIVPMSYSLISKSSLFPIRPSFFLLGGDVFADRNVFPGINLCHFRATPGPPRLNEENHPIHFVLSGS
jgi:hypothetical protein